jgi:radical SAM superfamily enzyme YgiQ (UPF0313 family)
MLKVCLINPPDDLEAFLGAGARLITPFEPLGLLYIAAVVKEAGYNVSVIDAYAQKISTEELKNKIADSRPDVIGMTTFTSNGALVYDLGRWLKSEFSEITVVLGNIHASVYAEQYLKNKCCDIVVHGEGERTFLEILKSIAADRRDFSDIVGISYLRNGTFIATGEEQVIEDLSALPFPARDLVDQRLYNIPAISNLPYSAKKNSIGKHMFTSRGCPNRCTFCAVHRNRQRYSDIMKVVDEMELLTTKYNADYIFIMDSLFISNKQRVLGICSEIRNRNLRIKWGCEAHVRYIDEELLKAMESAGCHDMAFGIESGVQRLLNNVHKGTHLDKIKQAIKLVKKTTEIKVSGLFILGLPGETYQDSLQTIAFAKELPLDMAQFSILVPYPGSQIFDELSQKGEIDTGIRPNGSLDTSVWLRYSSYISYTKNEPIWVTPELTGSMLKKLQKRALRDFYFRPHQFWIQLKRLRFSEVDTAIKTFWETFFN